jgi:hypothetical protein
MACQHCGAAYDSGLVEWVEMSLVRKIWFVIASLMYSIAFAVVGWLSFKLMWSFFSSGPFSSEIGKNVPPAFGFAGMASYGLAIQIIQLRRLYSSVCRTNARIDRILEFEMGLSKTPPTDNPFKPSRWFGGGLQLLLLFTGWIPVAVAWVIAVIMQRA